MYRVIAQTLDGTPTEELAVKNLQFSEVLNRPGAIAFTMPIKDPKCRSDVLYPGRTQLVVMNDDEKMAGGYLWTSMKQERFVRFGGEGWFSMFGQRRVDVDRSYTAWDQFDIAWDLIALTQAKTDGHLGITRYSEADSGVTRNITYEGTERKPVNKALEQLAALDNGFDFDISPNKEWKTYYPRRGTKRRDISFELGKNITGYGWTVSAKETATELTGIGAGESDGMMTSTQADATARAAYKLRQDEVPFKDVDNQSVLDGLTVEELRQRAVIVERPQFQVQVSEDMALGTFHPGDEAKVVIDDGYVQINRFMRIIALSISITDEGREAVGVYFDEAVE